jgi:UDP:flavonoid glycosyltransferase YjiC (YdhE family)
MKAAPDFDDQNISASFPGREKQKGINALKWDIKHVFIDAGPGQLKDLGEIIKEFPADVVLADFTFGGAKWFHEKGGPVWASFGHMPPTFSSQDTAPYGLGMFPNTSAPGRFRNRFLNWLVTNVLFKDVVTHTDKKRAEEGLSAEHKSPLDTAVSPYLLLQGTIPEFEYPRSDKPPQVHFVGPFLPEPPTDFTPPVWWSEIVDTNRPVVHVTQGTIDTDPARLILPTIEALAGEDVVVVATTGGQPVDILKPASLPANVRIAPFIPHHFLLPHVDVMVTNGGYNGVHIALANGVPLVVNGHTEDKPEVGNRVAWAGVGIKIKERQPTSARIKEAVQKILADSSYKERARKMQASFAHYDTPDLCARLLEQLAETKAPVTVLQDRKTPLWVEE